MNTGFWKELSGRLPAWMDSGLRAKWFGRKVARRWARGRDVRIIRGLGEGLWINILGSNPEYVLGENEMPVQEALAALLHPGAVFFDIGANVGFFTLIAARLVDPAGHVFAFEPLPANAAAVRRNARLNNFEHVTVFERAVSDHSGTGELLVAGYSGGSALSTAGAPPDVTGNMTVYLVTIDDLLSRKQVQPPDVIKIDVEGAEMQVLRGMSDSLLRFHPVLIYEVDDHDHQAFRRKQQEIESFLRQLDYRVYPLKETYPQIDWLVANYLALPPDRWLDEKLAVLVDNHGAGTAQAAGETLVSDMTVEGD